MSERGRRGNYYNAPTHIKSVPGLVTKKDDTHTDFYSGSAEAIVAAGLLDEEHLPGRPGRNLTSCSYRPTGAERIKGESWSRVPGYMHVVRSASGAYSVRLNVSREERARRQAVQEDREAEIDRGGWASPPATAERRQEVARTLLETLIKSMGHNEVQRMLDDAKPRRTVPRPKHLQLVSWSQ